MTAQVPISFLRNGPADAATTLVLAHGAGAAMDTPFLESIAGQVAQASIQVVRFEFPYMAKRREDGKNRPPDRQPVLLDYWRKVVAALEDTRLFIGGKSMGGRMASMVADEVKAAGLVCLGYPFHPLGKPERLRIEHLQEIKTPTLILQGERDGFGHRQEVVDYPLAKTVQLQWLTDGDHSFRPRKAAEVSETQNLAEAAQAIVAFLQKKQA